VVEKGLFPKHAKEKGGEGKKYREFWWLPGLASGLEKFAEEEREGVGRKNFGK